MPTSGTKCNKLSFSEEDAATLTERYDTTTVLTLLQEIANYPHTKIDWNELVKKTSTGISNAREYQMLWRHLAYRDALPEKFEDGAQPLDDDSDLDCELEALPPVSEESALEAAACVKVMVASCTFSESTPTSSTIEAPLTIHVPVCHSSRTPNETSQPSNLMERTTMTFPVTVPRQTLPTISSTDGIETKGNIGGNLASKRKRKQWSEEEDMQLRAAVQRFGEGNWATMAKGDNFPIKRSATQLAQRWSTLRKKDCSANSGTNLPNPQYTTAEQLATRHSLSLALDMPFKKLTTPGISAPVRTSASIKNQVQPCTSKVVSTVQSSSVPPQHPSQQVLLGSAKSKLTSENPVSKCNPVSDPVLKSTTVHSGAKVTSENPVSKCNPVSDPVLKSTTIHSGAKVTSENPVSKCNPVSDPVLKSTTIHSGAKVTSENPVSKCNPVSDPVLKSTTIHSGAKVVPRSIAVSQFKGVQVRNMVGSVPAGSFLTKTPISAGLPSDIKDKHVSSGVGGALPKQEVNPTKDCRVSNVGSIPKEKAREVGTPVVTARCQVDGNPNKGRVDVVKPKSMPPIKVAGEKISQPKAVPQNTGGCVEQGSVKNSNFTPKTETTENENGKLHKEGQDSEQDKRKNSISGSSDNQNTNVKHVNLPTQDQCKQNLEPPKIVKSEN